MSETKYIRGLINANKRHHVMHEIYSTGSIIIYLILYGVGKKLTFDKLTLMRQYKSNMTGNSNLLSISINFLMKSNFIKLNVESSLCYLCEFLYYYMQSHDTSLDALRFSKCNQILSR